MTTSPPTQDALDKLEALRKLATPGWHANPVNPQSVTSSQSHPIWTLSDDFHRQCMHGTGQDREYMLALYDAAPALIELARRALATPINGEDREVLGKIIDPLCFELGKALDDAEGEPPELRQKATAMFELRRGVALTKADACLRALASRGGGEPTDEVVEAVAEAICDDEWAGTQPWPHKPASFLERYRDRARAAIKAYLAASPPIPVQGGGEEP